MKKYYPYPSDRKAKKFYIITDDDKKIYFGDSRYQHYLYYSNFHFFLCLFIYAFLLISFKCPSVKCSYLESPKYNLLLLLVII